MKRGLIQIYTGDGKGKTTAAVGLACRAIAHGKKVCYIYFHKDPEKWNYGELKTLKKLGIAVFGFAKEYPYFHKNVSIENIKKECGKSLEFINDIFKKKKYDILIIDEILISVRDGSISEQELLDLLDKKPKNLEIVLTGRQATKNIIKKADLVTEMKKIKHPYDKGIKSRKGIEF